MSKLIDMTGWNMCEHGVLDSRLTVIKRSEDYITPCGNRITQWLCECNCEGHKRIIARGTDLRNGNTKSCGCLYRESAKQMGINNSKTNTYDLVSYNYGVGWANNSGMQFKFELSDYEFIKDYCWSTYTDNKGYIRLETTIKINGEYKRTSMAQLLTGENDIDHEDKDTMNNQRSNLRIANRTQQVENRRKNKNNTSGFVGVCWNKNIHQWMAYITINRKRINLGYFTQKRDAVVARLNAERKYFDPMFAPQRHLFVEYNIIE